MKTIDFIWKLLYWCTGISRTASVNQLESFFSHFFISSDTCRGFVLGRKTHGSARCCWKLLDGRKTVQRKLSCSQWVQAEQKIKTRKDVSHVKNYKMLCVAEKFTWTTPYQLVVVVSWCGDVFPQQGQKSSSELMEASFMYLYTKIETSVCIGFIFRYLVSVWLCVYQHPDLKQRRDFISYWLDFQDFLLCQLWLHCVCSP